MLLHAVYLTTDVIGVAVARQVGAVLWPISEISTLPVQIINLYVNNCVSIIVDISNWQNPVDVIETIPQK